MNAHDHLLQPVRLRRLIYNAMEDKALIEADTDTGYIVIDMHELDAMEGGDVMSVFSPEELAIIDCFLTAAARTFE